MMVRCLAVVANRLADFSTNGSLNLARVDVLAQRLTRSPLRLTDPSGGVLIAGRTTAPRYINNTQDNNPIMQGGK